MGKVIAVVDDLFFAAKIRGTAEQLGVDVKFARTLEALVAAAKQENALTIIVDLHSRRINPIEIARSLKSETQPQDLNLVGFFSHVETELQRAALEAGFDRVLPRSAFVNQLVEILRSASTDSTD